MLDCLRHEIITRSAFFSITSISLIRGSLAEILGDGNKPRISLLRSTNGSQFRKIYLSTGTRYLYRFQRLV